MLLLRFPSIIQVTCIVVACASSYLLYFELTTGRRRRQLVVKHGCKPVKRIKTRDPLLGLDAVFAAFLWGRQHTLLENASKHLVASGRKTVEINLLGAMTIWTTEAENIKAVLSLNFKSFETPSPTKELDLVIGNGIFTNNGEAWHQSRELLRPSFARSQIADLAMLEKPVSRFMDKLPRDGSTVDLSKLFSELTLATGIEFVFGDCGDETDSDAQVADSHIFAEAWHRVSNFHGSEGHPGKFWLWHFLLDRVRMNPDFRENCKIVHAFVDKLVEQCLSAKQPPSSSTSSPPTTTSPRYLFLRALASQTPDQRRIRTEALSVLFASHDSTAALLTNLFFLLSRHPAICARLHHEITTALPRRQPPTYEHLKNLRFLRAVLNETQRLYPIVPVGGRQAREDTVLPRGGGAEEMSPVVVKKGQLVLFDVWSMHRSKAVYGADAAVFRPERWMDEGGKKGIRMGWEFLPFSGGARACPGQNFALTQISYATVRIMQEFDRVESRDPEPWREHISFVCANLGGCRVGLIPREGEEEEEEEEEEDGV